MLSLLFLKLFDKGVVSIMRMDFELLEEIIEDLDEKGRTYEAIKKSMERIRAEIREEILECLEMNCRGGE